MSHGKMSHKSLTFTMYSCKMTGGFLSEKKKGLILWYEQKNYHKQKREKTKQKKKTKKQGMWCHSCNNLRRLNSSTYNTP